MQNFFVAAGNFSNSIIYLLGVVSINGMHNSLVNNYDN